MGAPTKSSLLDAQRWLPELVTTLRERLEVVSVQPSARCGLGLLASRLDALADLLDPAPPRPRRAPKARPAAAPPVDVEALVAALRDPVAEVAVAAAAKLGAHGGERAREALLEVFESLDGYFNSDTRVAAVRELAALLDRDDLGPLRSAARDLDATVSLAAIEALGARGDARSASVLLEVLEDETGFFVTETRVAAAEGLRYARAPERERIATLCARERDPEVTERLRRVVGDAG